MATTNAPRELSPDERFVRYLVDGALHLQVCDECSHQVFFPRVICPRCGSSALRWEPAAAATVYSSTVVRRKKERGGDYNVAIVEFDGGARMMSRVEGLPPDEITIGLFVEAFLQPGADVPLVLFRPRAGVGA